MISRQNQKLIGSLLTPSQFSMAVAILAGLVVTVGVLIAFETHVSAIQEQLRAWQPPATPKALTQPGETLTENDRPTLEGSWPLLIVWSFVGLGVYALTMALVHSLGSAKELVDSMDYVHAKPQLQVEDAVEHFVLRAVSIAMSVILGVIFIERVLPYSITAAHAASADFSTAMGALYVFLSFAIVVITIHAQTIFLRLALGRVRVF